jgi:hypothetical protein
MFDSPLVSVNKGGKLEVVVAGAAPGATSTSEFDDKPNQENTTAVSSAISLFALGEYGVF